MSLNDEFDKAHEYDRHIQYTTIKPYKPRNHAIIKPTNSIKTPIWGRSGADHVLCITIGLQSG